MDIFKLQLCLPLKMGAHNQPLTLCKTVNFHKVCKNDPHQVSKKFYLKLPFRYLIVYLVLIFFLTFQEYFNAKTLKMSVEERMPAFQVYYSARNF